MFIIKQIKEIFREDDVSLNYRWRIVKESFKFKNSYYLHETLSCILIGFIIGQSVRNIYFLGFNLWSLLTIIIGIITILIIGCEWLSKTKK